jgi:alpha-1,6-mannosyltransferase
VSPSATLAPERVTHRARPAPRRRRRVVDVALWYGDHGGGIRTYLDAKAAYATASGDFEHHLVVPGELGVRAFTLPTSNGYQVPFGFTRVEEVLRSLRPDVIVAHDPFWSLPAALRVASDLGAAVIGVHHASSQLEAASLRGPQRVYRRAFERWRSRGYARADAVMTASPVGVDSARRILPLRFGLDPAFHPRPEVQRGRAVLYAGRLAREKGLLDLIEAAALARTPWPLRIVGCGPCENAARSLVARRGLAWRTTFEPFIERRDHLAQTYAFASCVVMPGPYETFGLVALEAAASGARVVACDSAPSARAAAAVAHTFPAGDVRALLAAAEAARAAACDPDAAWRIATGHTWERAFEAEQRDLAALLG